MRGPSGSGNRIAGPCRRRLAERFGEEVAGQARIIYGGSASPEHAAALLADPEVDGLGATRRGRDPAAFAEIVARIAYRMSIPSPKL